MNRVDVVLAKSMKAIWLHVVSSTYIGYNWIINNRNVDIIGPIMATIDLYVMQSLIPVVVYCSNLRGFTVVCKL